MKTEVEKAAESHPIYKRLADFKIENAIVWADGYVIGSAAERERIIDHIVDQIEAYPMFPEEKQSWITYIKSLKT